MPYTISAFYALGKYTFTYEASGDEVVTLNTKVMNNDDERFMQRVTVYHGDTK